MGISAYKRYRRKTTLKLVLIGVIMGVIYVSFSDGITALMPLSNAIVIGVILGLFVAFFEFTWLNPTRRRRMNFTQLLLTRVLTYTVVISTTLFLVFSGSRALWFSKSYQEVLKSDEFQNFISHGDFVIAISYTTGIIFLITFGYQVSRKLGQGYLGNIISGKYFKPKEKERVFLFMNLINLNQAFAQNGAEQSFNFVNDFLFDATPEILTNKGKIYEYVDNQMVIFWNSATDLPKARSCFFAIARKIELKRNEYIKRYHIVPEVNGALHFGNVIQGEIGVVPTNIAFYGDVLNTTARIASLAKNRNQLLCSAESARYFPDTGRTIISELKGKKQQAAIMELAE